MLDVSRLDAIVCTTALEVELLAALVRERKLRRELQQIVPKPARPKPFTPREQPPPPPPPEEFIGPQRPANEWDWIPGNKATVPQIQLAVCSRWNVMIMELRSPRRAVEIVTPRQIAMMLCRALTLKSYPEIGRRFNNRDHSTILHSVLKFDWLRRELLGELSGQDMLGVWVDRAYQRYHHRLAQSQVAPGPYRYSRLSTDGQASHG
jgi:Bacterial dnaA protein helix-turn-helix